MLVGALIVTIETAALDRDVIKMIGGCDIPSLHQVMTVIVAVRRIAALHEIPRNVRFHQAMMVREGFASASNASSTMYLKLMSACLWICGRSSRNLARACRPQVSAQDRGDLSFGVSQQHRVRNSAHDLVAFGIPGLRRNVAVSNYRSDLSSVGCPDGLEVTPHDPGGERKVCPRSWANPEDGQHARLCGLPHA
ncbi:hypothetical protein ACVWZW_006907 [Bradyrhizobium sp. F1.13.4]